MSSNRKFKFAGVSKVNGRFTLRATNREQYEEILKRDKNTHINIIKLDKPMTKDQIRETLVRRPAFKQAAILAMLTRGEAPVARKAPAKKAATKARKPASTEVSAAA